MQKVPDRYRKPVGGLLIGILACLLVSGCGGNDEILRQDLDQLGQRIVELERSSGRWQIQLAELEEKVLLLEDRVEAHRISLERRGVVARRRVDELPSYQPPASEASYSYVASLPVQRLAPPSVGSEADGPEQSAAELVITNDSLDEYVSLYGGNLTVVAGPGADGEDQPGSQRTTIPPVVLGDRLPTTSAEQSSTSTVSQPRADRPLELYQESLRYFNAGQYETALQGFNAFLDTRPAQDYQDNALYWIGECHYATGQYQEALVTFQRVVDEYPDGNKVPDSLLKIGLTYERLNNRREASMVLSVLVETYPLTEAARRASQRLSELN